MERHKVVRTLAFLAARLGSIQQQMQSAVFRTSQYRNGPDLKAREIANLEYTLGMVRNLWSGYWGKAFDELEAQLAAAKMEAASEQD